MAFNTRMSVTSFEEVHRILSKYVPPSRSMREAYTLERMQALMTALGNPQDTLKVIHIAGTSGKTSTAYYMAALLRQSGHTVGLTVSPHIDEVNERLQIDMLPMEEKKYCRFFSKFMELLYETDIKPTYFELLIAFAYWAFAKEKVEYAVIEVGLGGLLDGTNVIHQPDKVCVITDIGLDHIEVLGRSVAEITAQKAGIIQPHNVVFMYEQGEEVMQVVREVCDQMQATLHEVWKLPAKDLPPNLPLFQRRNWYLAWSTYRYVAERDALPVLTEEQLATSTVAHIPARMEIIRLKDGKVIVLDGAHNAQKMETLAKSLRARFPKTKFAVLLGLVQSKNFRLRTSLQEILAVADHLIITSFDTEQDVRKVSVNPIKVAEYCHALGYDKWETVSDLRKAYQALLERPEPVLLVTGSFYLLSQIRPLIAEAPKP